MKFRSFKKSKFFNFLPISAVFIGFFLSHSCSAKELVVRVAGGPLVAELLATESGYLFKGPVLQKAEHEINGKTIDVKKAKAKPGKIFVGGITQEITDEDIKQYFGQYGNITQLEMPFDKTKNQRKPFCFITFDNDSVVKELLKRPKQTIKDKQVDVKKAATQPAQMGRGGFGGGWGAAGGRGGRGGRGGGWGGQGGWDQGGWGGDYGYGGGYDNGYAAGGGYDYYGSGGGYGGGYGMDTSSSYGGGYGGGAPARGGGGGRGGGRGGRGGQRHQPY